MNKLIIPRAVTLVYKQATMNEDRMRRSNARVMRDPEVVDLLEMMI